MDCKDCGKELNPLNWRKSSSSKKYYVCNSCLSQRSKAYYHSHLETSRAYARDNVKLKYHDNRNAVLLLLGNKCSNPECPIPEERLDKRCLQVDHVFNNGAEDRRNFGGTGHGTNSAMYWRHVLREVQKGSKEYQLLCAYCNFRKRYL